MSLPNVDHAFPASAPDKPSAAKLVLRSPASTAQFDSALRRLLWSGGRETPLIVDMSALEAAPDGVMIKEFANKLRRFAGLGLGRVAVLACEDHLFGVARMLTTRAELGGVEARAFRSEGAAKSWAERRLSTDPAAA